jgi:hypothetical protein
MKLIIPFEKAEQLGFSFGPKAPRPPGGGWQSIPHGKHGGYRKKKGADWEYWYPDKGIVGRPHHEDIWEHHKVEGKPLEGGHPLAEEVAKKEELNEPEKPKVENIEDPGKYETTGYVFGSRAELWQLAHEGDLEKDPKVAYQLVEKSNVMRGEVKAESFLAEKDAGSTPAAAWMKYRLLSAIQKRPEDSSEARKTFVETIGLLQVSLAPLRTELEITELMREWDELLSGKKVVQQFSKKSMEAMGFGELWSEAPTHYLFRKKMPGEIKNEYLKLQEQRSEERV